MADRTADTLEAWLREHPWVRMVCRDGSGAYAEAIRRALPTAVQVANRWHLWHNLAEAVLKEVAAHSACWGKTGPPPREGTRAATTPAVLEMIASMPVVQCMWLVCSIQGARISQNPGPTGSMKSPRAMK